MSESRAMIRFVKRSLDAVGAQDVIVSHCIIHQENLCTIVLAFAEIMKNAFQCVDYIRSRRLIHRQFEAFIENKDCDYHDVVYFSTIRSV